MGLSKNLNQQWEDHRERAEWEDRFVTFGYILLQALKEIAEITPGVFCDHNKIAQDALDKFNDKVKKP